MFNLSTLYLKPFIGLLPFEYNNGKGMLSSVEQAFVGRDARRAPLKTPAWEASFSDETQKMHAFFYFYFFPCLPQIVETGDKNRDDFHCMQTNLVMSMRFIFGDY